MATSKQWKAAFAAGQWNERLIHLYGKSDVELCRQRQRYIEALTCFEQYYGVNREVCLYSAPGRTELGGNHTDHQHGFGLAAAVQLDLIAVVAQNDDDYIRVKSRGFNKLDVIDLDELHPQDTESTHSASLIRGIAEGFRGKGGQVGGFDAYTSSDVPRGSGLSSSAAFETAISTIINHEFNGGRFSSIETALISQRAENHYFGKPSGLLDQLTSALGGAVFADFADPSAPLTQKLHTAGLLPQGMALCVTDTHSSHSEQNHEFAEIRTEMEAVAACMGASVLGKTTEADFWKKLNHIRAICGDRAALRTLHFYRENERTREEYLALSRHDFSAFLKGISQSGISSFEYNQNVYCSTTPKEQSVSVALALTRAILDGVENSAWRMQGGGFGGTIQAFLPVEHLSHYCSQMEAAFGKGSCYVLSLREEGGICF